MTRRILSWKSRFLSFGGRLVLIKHVLSSIPTHLLLAAAVPTPVFNMLEQVCAKLLWGTTEAISKYHWIQWSQLCYPEEDGGIGLRRVRDVNTAFSYKFWWNFSVGTSL